MVGKINKENANIIISTLKSEDDSRASITQNDGNANNMIEPMLNDGLCPSTFDVSDNNSIRRNSSESKKK